MVAPEVQTDCQWNIRSIDESPKLSLEGFVMHRILDGSGMDGVGCEYVVIEPYKVLDPHIHKKGHAIILVIDGNGFALIGETRQKIEKHSIINIPPGTPHGLEAGDVPLIVYGFQVPGIIDSNNDADIYFLQDNRKGEVIACT